MIIGKQFIKKVFDIIDIFLNVLVVFFVLQKFIGFNLNWMKYKLYLIMSKFNRNMKENM